METTRQTGLRHDDTTIALHWVTAILIALLWALGQIIDWFPRRPARINARSTHILLGVILVGVFCTRVAWRLLRGSRLPAPGAGWLGSLGKATHYALYALLAATMLLGTLNVWTRGDEFFRLLAFPRLSPGNNELKRNVEYLHALGANILVSLAFLHALAALAHHFIRRDGMLRRMLR